MLRLHYVSIGIRHVCLCFQIVAISIANCCGRASLLVGALKLRLFRLAIEMALICILKQNDFNMGSLLRTCLNKRKADFFETQNLERFGTPYFKFGFLQTALFTSFGKYTREGSGYHRFVQNTLIFLLRLWKLWLCLIVILVMWIAYIFCKTLEYNWIKSQKKKIFPFSP